MDARDDYLALYDHTHFVRHGKGRSSSSTIPRPSSGGPSCPTTGHRLDRLARRCGEDWTVQTILQEREQLLTRDGWEARMRVAEPGFGGAWRGAR